MIIGSTNACLNTRGLLARCLRSTQPQSSHQPIHSLDQASSCIPPALQLLQEPGQQQRHRAGSTVASTSRKLQHSVPQASAIGQQPSTPKCSGWPSRLSLHSMPLQQPSTSLFAGFCSKPLHFNTFSCRHGHIISAARSRSQVSQSGNQPSNISSLNHELDSNVDNGTGGNNGGGGSGIKNTAAAGPDPAGNRNWGKVATLALRVLAGLAVSLIIIVTAGPSIVSTGPGLAITLALVNLFLPGSVHVDKVPSCHGRFESLYHAL